MGPPREPNQVFCILPRTIGSPLAPYITDAESKICVDDAPYGPPLPPHPNAAVPSRITIAIIAVLRPRDGATIGIGAIASSIIAAVSFSPRAGASAAVVECPQPGPRGAPAPAIPANAISSSRAWIARPPKSVAVIEKVSVAPEATR